MTSILWFKNDLRLHDNEALIKAQEESTSIIFLYCIDPRNFEKLEYGFRKTSLLRLKFLQQTLENLKENLEDLGGHLLIRVGHPEKIIPGIVDSYKVDKLFAEQEYADEELNVVEQLRINLSDRIDLSFIWGRTLYHKNDIPFSIDKIPLTSKAYRIPVGKQTVVRELFEIPERLKGLKNVVSDPFPDYSVLGFTKAEMEQIKEPFVKGGEEEGLKRLQFYLFDTEQLTSYRWTRNRSKGMEYSSKFSPYLALGCLSPREIYFQVKRYEEEVKKNASTWWMIFELVWRDYFTFKGMRIGNQIYATEGFKNKELEFNNNHELFERWCKGETGIPFVDAHMRQLNETGFMSNRGRVNCSSFLIHDYKIDWTWGAAYFENRLIDYDVHVNWLNWHTQAYEIWYTNPINQSIKYSAKEFIQEWIPELSSIDSNLIYIPWHEVSKQNYPMIAYPEPAELFSKWNRSINKILKSVGE